jgi:glutaredoxin
VRLLGRGKGRVRTVTLVTRQGCPACAEAEALVAREARRAGADYVERDVDADERDLQAYGHKVPVVLLDGREHTYWGVDRDELRAALRARA